MLTIALASGQTHTHQLAAVRIYTARNSLFSAPCPSSLQEVKVRVTGHHRGTLSEENRAHTFLRKLTTQSRTERIKWSDLNEGEKCFLFRLASAKTRAVVLSVCFLEQQHRLCPRTCATCRFGDPLGTHCYQSWGGAYPSVSTSPLGDSDALI